ncbi:MAG: DMT family transporter [Pararhodobacter sp.]|nr:DMT family transporter [Pararhodobacter sp.]
MLTDNARGALMMMGAMAAFVINDALMKLVAVEMPLFQALFLRGLITTVVFFVIARRLGALRHALDRRDRALITLRVLAEAGSAYFFLTALFNMPLANVTAILQALPLTITLAGALFLREPVGWRRLLAILVGFVGVLLIVRPDADGFDHYAIMALMAVACVTLRDLVTRRMSRTVPSMTVALATAGGVTLFAFVGALSEGWVMPSAGVRWALSGAGLLIVAGYLLSITAMRVGELGVVSPFRYTGLVWALVLGWLIFGDWPDGVTLAGAALIVATGLFSLYREHRVRRAQARA